MHDRKKCYNLGRRLSLENKSMIMHLRNMINDNSHKIFFKNIHIIKYIQLKKVIEKRSV